LPAAVERVGVFHSRNPEEIAHTAKQAGLTAVQLHGGFDEKLLESLAVKFAGRVRIIQTLHWKIDHPGSSAAQLSDQIERLAALGIADRVLIDSKLGATGGGTGVAFDWNAAHDIFASVPRGIHLIVAGGLKPGNVADAISQLRPWGVDVSSGIEASPGKKDPARLANFIKNARGVQKL
jgi:phosphoribosylanthranilate isomerase